MHQGREKRDHFKELDCFTTDWQHSFDSFFRSFELNCFDIERVCVGDKNSLSSLDAQLWHSKVEDICQVFGSFVCYHVDEKEVKTEEGSEHDAAPSAMKLMMDAAKKHSENHLPPKDPSKLRIEGD